MPNIRNYWMPNVEQAKKTQGRLLDSTHTLIAKTRAAYNIFTDFLKDRTGHIPKIAYIGHSSLDPLYHFGDQPLPPQSFTNVFHAYGHAGTKGTGALIKCWLRHPEWPTLSVLGNSNSEYNIGQSNNIKMISKVSINELGIIQRASAIHVYPTSREGFGHALNEARGSGALLVATDFGPMNEFVQEGYSGYLMKIDSENVESFQLFGTLRPVQVRMNSNDICNGMEKVFKTSMADRIRMGEAGRAGFLADRLYFTEMVKILKNEALRRFNGEEL